MSILDRLEARFSTVQTLDLRSKTTREELLGLVRVARAGQNLVDELGILFPDELSELRSALASLEDADTKGGTTDA